VSALLVEVVLRGAGRGAADASDGVQELRHLAESAGFVAAAQIVARRDRPDPALYLGRGKVEEIRGQLA